MNYAAKGLWQSNPHLRDRAAARRMLVRSVASSTAVETGRSVRDVEDLLRGLPRAAGYHSA